MRSLADTFDLEYHVPDDIERCEATFLFAITGGSIEARPSLYHSDVPEARRSLILLERTVVRSCYQTVASFFSADVAQHVASAIDLTFDLLLDSIDELPDLSDMQP